MYEAIFTTILFAFGYFMGNRNEKKHYKSIESRERSNIGLPALTYGKVLQSTSLDFEGGRLVMGNVVVSVDHFKRTLAALRSMVGGNVTTYETLVDRARREAVLRMKEDARGSVLVANVRIETSSIGKTACCPAPWIEPM